MAIATLISNAPPASDAADLEESTTPGPQNDPGRHGPSRLEREPTIEERDAAAGPPPADASQPTAVQMLVNRSRLAQEMKQIPAYRNILVIEDNLRDSHRLSATLRGVLGYDTNIRQCRSLGSAIDEVLSSQPEIVFLDDRLGPVDKAERSVAFLRAARCEAVIIVISGFADRRRRTDILKLGVDEVIDKDELDSMSICQVLIGITARRKHHE